MADSLLYCYEMVPESSSLPSPQLLPKLSSDIVWREEEKRWLVFEVRDERGEADLDGWLVRLWFYRSGVEKAYAAGWQFVKEKGRIRIFGLDLERGDYIVRLQLSRSGQKHEAKFKLAVAPSLFKRKIESNLSFSYETRVARSFTINYAIGATAELEFNYSAGGKISNALTSLWNIDASADLPLSWSIGSVTSKHLSFIYNQISFVSSPLSLEYNVGDAVGINFTFEYDFVASKVSQSLYLTNSISNEPKLYVRMLAEELEVEPKAVVVDEDEDRAVTFRLWSGKHRVSAFASVQAILHPKFLFPTATIAGNEVSVQIYTEYLVVGENRLELRLFDDARERRIQCSVFYQPKPLSATAFPRLSPF